MALAHKTQSSPDQDLYETDQCAWLLHNASLPRAGCAGDADLEKIAEELEDMGRSEAGLGKSPWGAAASVEVAVSAGDGRFVLAWTLGLIAS